MDMNNRAAIRVLLWQYAAERCHFEPTLDDIMRVLDAAVAKATRQVNGKPA